MIFQKCPRKIRRNPKTTTQKNKFTFSIWNYGSLFDCFFSAWHLETLGIQSYSQMMIRVSNHLLSTVFGFHYHSQKVIGSLGKYPSKHLLLEGPRRKRGLFATRAPHRPHLGAADAMIPNPTAKSSRNFCTVEVGSSSHYLQVFLHPRWLFG